MVSIKKHNKFALIIVVLVCVLIAFMIWTRFQIEGQFVDKGGGQITDQRGKPIE